MGSTYQAVGIGVTSGLLVILTFAFLHDPKEVKTMSKPNEVKTVQSNYAIGQNQNVKVEPEDSVKMKEKRDEISRQLNQMKRDYGKLSCEMLELKAKHGEQLSTKVSQFGGWCKQASTSTGGNHIFDRSLTEALSHFFSGKRVASFGDGPGDYKKNIDKTGRLKVYDAYDGAPYSEENSKGGVKFLDLTAPQYGLPAYDWIMSLEVAEHIPSQFESVYVDNIARHAKEGIVLSWAVPGQGGLSHVNNRPFVYVKKILREKGFEHDEKASLSLKQKSTLPWLRNNVNVYRRIPSSPLKQNEL